jgi:hypothetical protein
MPSVHTASKATSLKAKDRPYHGRKYNKIGWYASATTIAFAPSLRKDKWLGMAKEKTMEYAEEQATRGLTMDEDAWSKGEFLWLFRCM